jgi:3-dehydroquinate synthase
MINVVKTVKVKTETSAYDVQIENGLVQRVGEAIRELFPDRSRFFVITTPPIRKHWGTALTESLDKANIAHQVVEVPDGERTKNLNTIEDLSDKLVKRGADRKSVFIALGGGVVGDMTGFMASIYMRGVEFVQVPTTLLAQVDASIGGKTGVDLKSGKNLVGTFYQPRAVFIDPGVLSTLPEREYRSGLFEALKCGIISNPEIFGFMEEQRTKILQREPEPLEWLIAECVRVKADVVNADEHEMGVRRILNFGHTIGHALEAETSYKQFLHGEAVAWGMIAASMISAAMQRTDSDTARRIISTVLAYAPLPKVESRGKKIVGRLRTDKKTMDGIVHFVLPLEIGRVEVVPDVPERTVVQAIDELRYLSQA